MVLRFYLLLFFLLYFLIVFVWTSYRVYKQTGVNPFVFSGTDSAHDFAGQPFKGISVLLLLVVLIYAVIPQYYPYLLPIWYLESSLLRLIGLVLLHLSLLWIAIAQVQMGHSWRIGIDKENPTELKTSGVFGLSRNPVFLGILVAMIGLFFVLPNALSFLIVGAGWIVLQIQIRLEEEYLLKVHRNAYQEYLQRVKRWI